MGKPNHSSNGMRASSCIVNVHGNCSVFVQKTTNILSATATDFHPGNCSHNIENKTNTQVDENKHELTICVYISIKYIYLLLAVPFRLSKS